MRVLNLIEVKVIRLIMVSRIIFKDYNLNLYYIQPEFLFRCPILFYNLQINGYSVG